MRWSWKIGEFAGIGVYMHATFLLVIGFIAFTSWLQQRTVAGVVEGTLFILAIFACVVMHEYGHALTARRYGIATRDITLLPIGGVARLERIPDVPIQEFWVALAGPAVNVVLAAALFAWLTLSGGWMPLDEIGVATGSFLERLMVVNLWLVGFNLIPAFPMDGGRVLRALLAMRTDYVRATQAAASIGQALALAFAFVGFFANPFLIFIALFVWIGASQEAGMVQMKSAIGGIPVARAMITDFRSVAPSDPLSSVVKLILSGSQTDFPVVEGDRVVGVLRRDDLLRSLAERGEAAPVSQVMRREVQTTEPGEMMEVAFLRLQGCDCNTLPVVDKGRLVGLLTEDNVGEFIMIQAARPRRGPVKPSSA